MTDVLEKEIEAALGRMVSKHHGLCLKFVSPGRAGVPDRLVLMPGGRLVFVELKKPRGGRLAALQAWWRDRLLSLGFLSVVVSNHGDIADLEAIIVGDV